MPALIRLRDRQDFTAPTPTLLDEALLTVPPPAGFEPSTRFQWITIHVDRGARPPVVTSVAPTTGGEATIIQVSAITTGDPVANWAWDFGAGANPSTSIEASPQITLGPAGTYPCTLTVDNPAGADLFNFDLVVTPPPPDITAVDPPGGDDDTDVTFTPTNIGGPVATWVWDFGGAATPNTSSAPSPTVHVTGPGVYDASVTAINVSGADQYFFQLTVNESGPPRILSVSPLEGYGRTEVTFDVATAGPPATAWLWEFNGAATPDTSTAQSPQVRLNMPGIYPCRVTVTNAYGSTPFDFMFEVKVHKMPLTLHVFTDNLGNPPKLWWNMASWSRDDVFAWFDTYVNSIYAPAAIEIDNAQFVLEFITDRPELYNIDTGPEESALFTDFLYVNGPWDRLHMYVCNDQNYGGWGGVMDDVACDYTNEGRGCIVISYQTPYAQKVQAHELGHVFNLPHTRTQTPLTALNYNLMGYYTDDVSLLEFINVEDVGYCQIWDGNPISQFQVSNDWVNLYSGLP
ncbi:MAG: PKD domain-containing protein [bacterium]